MSERITATVWDALASVCADVTGIKHVFAAGVTASVRTETGLVVPQVDEFAASGLPCIVVGLRDWSGLTGGGWTRMTYDWELAVWHQRQPLGAIIPVLADAIDALRDGFEAHSKAKLHAEQPTWDLASALVKGGAGIQQRALGDPENPRYHLVAPVTAEVKVNVRTNPQPA